MHLIEKIHIYITKHNLLNPNDHIVIGVSGGPDSIFLMHVLKHFKDTYNLSLTAAHLDHEWRPNSSLDTTFCAEAAQSLGIDFVAEKASQLPVQFKKIGSQEALGRAMRRYFLQSIKEQAHAQSIALAHHAQDQEETFFIRLIRGTTLSGLCGMKPREKDYIRPLLEINKDDIIAWLDTHNIPYLTDPSNESPSFLRNRIRAQVIPALQNADPRFNQNFLRTLDNLQKTDQFLESLTKKMFHAISEYQDTTHWIDISRLKNLPPIMHNRIIAYWIISENVPFVLTGKFIDEIKRFLFEGTAHLHTIHQRWSLEKKGNQARIVQTN